ncbi:hypothetical protein O3G_MSEX003716 [Manduca sexta]|uniref:Uncharacterized protein n=1 Tax=Manduca sexta TaxID=7130 RepID=A0A921YT56_MANSE|nr:hypothetical protein O3G_MSEX003716 [Manduca sexta]
MDNPMMTPNKILKLIHLAEDRSFQAAKAQRRRDFDEEEHKSITYEIVENKPTYAESSSSILDLERVEGFGESGQGGSSISKSAIFNPNELTGRSTGTEDTNRKTMSMDRYDIGDLKNKLDKQTLQVKEVMRNSIATNYSFHSKRDLSADEESLIRREGVFPFQPTNTLGEITPTNASSLSVGAYFKSKCPEFGNMLAHTNSPNKSMMLPSITEVSAKSSDINAAQSFNLDPSLDSVPVRQPRATNIIHEKTQNLNNATEKLCDKPQFNSTSKIDNEVINKDIKNQESAINKQNQFLKQNQSKLEQSFSAFMKSNKLMNSTTKPTDILLKNFHASLRPYTDDSEDHENSSLSISKIADYLGKQSNVSVAGLLLNNQKKQKKSPLAEVHLNNQAVNEDNLVSYLKDTKRTETASTTGTVDTVISMDKLRINEMPQLIVTHHSPKRDDFKTEDVKRSTRSRSPSSKSQSTLSTVQENFHSFKSGDSPLHTSKGEAKTSHVPSPNTVYRELDKSVDWREVLQQKSFKREGLVKEQWADIITSAVEGFVGVSCAINIAVTTLTESWLTGKLQFDNFPNEGKDFTMELPRQPILLSPGKTEQFTAYLTSKFEINASLPFTILLKDASIDCDLEQKGTVDVNIKMPVVQAMSCDGVNKICYPPIQEKTTLIKSFVLLSDSPVDLQLELLIVEGDTVFTIKNVQEIKRGDINKILMDRQGSTEDGTSKAKNKMMNRQLCRLSSGNAIRVTIKFNPPKLSDLNVDGNSLLTLNGTLVVKLMGVNTLLRKIELTGVVGSVNLVMTSQSNQLHITKEPSTITLANKGTITGVWVVKIQSHSEDYFPFKVAPSKFEIRPGCTKDIQLSYLGPEDNVQEASLVFEETGSGNKTSLSIFGGMEKKIFPIKTNYHIMSWVRSGRKELSLKNSMNKKVHIRCQIVGEGFSVDLPGGESRGIYSLAFGPNECRPLPIIFSPTCHYPQSATLHLVYDKNSDFSRKISLYGCEGGSSLKWSGLVTYGDTALVRALARAPLQLELYNRAAAPAFLCAHVRFNLQYAAAARGCVVSGARRVVCARARHAVSVSLPWAAIERRARAAHVSALATVTVLTGSEFTRRRILRIVTNESNGEIDTTLLPEHLRVLAEKFDGEDTSLDNYLKDFKETKSSLHELIGGLQELTAQIDLPQDFGEDATIIISDETVLEHHTLCD